MHLDTFTITPVSVPKGSATTKEFKVDKNGAPFARIAKFNAHNGGNWLVGFARISEGGRFDTYAEAEAFVRSF